MRLVKFLTCIALIMAMPYVVIAQEEITDDKPLRIAIDQEYSPYTLIGPTGEPTGLTVEFWKAWSKSTGQAIEFVASDWGDTLNALKNGDVDIHSGLFKNTKRAEWLDFVEPIHEIHSSLFFRSNDYPVPLSKLTGEKVGVWSESYQHQFLIDNYPDLTPVPAENGKELILMLLRGEVRAILNEVPSVNAELAAFGIPGDLDQHAKSQFSNYLQPAILEGNPELLQYINEGFAKIPATQLHALEKMWMPNPSDHFYAGASGPMEFTREEETWLSLNPAIKLGVTTFIKPFDIIDEVGGYTGLNPDLIYLLNKKLGINIVPEFFNSWGEVVKATTEGTIDGALNLSITPEREKTILYSKPYAFDPIIAVVNQANTEIHSWKNLKGKKVSIVKGGSIKEEIQSMIGGGSLIEVATDIIGLKKLKSNEVDVHVTWALPYDSSQKAEPIDGLKVVLTRNSEGGSLRVGIHKDRPELMSIIRKGFNAITHQELTNLRNKWLFQTIPDQTSSIKFSVGELAWLKTHPVVNLGIDKAYPPFEFLNADEEYVGIAADYLNIISKRTGLVFKVVPDLNWGQVLEGAQTGKVDLLPVASNTPDRRKYLNFTEPYISVSTAIFTRDDYPAVSGLKDFAGKIIAIPVGFSSNEEIAKKYPEINILAVPQMLDALQAIAKNEADLVLGNVAVLGHLIQTNNLNNLKIAAELPSNLSGGTFAMGSRIDWPDLASIIKKALASISDDEKLAIKNKWITFSSAAHLDPDEIVQKISELDTLAQEMLYLDDILTTSVLSYAFTKDTKWLEKYRLHEPKLVIIFDEMITHSGGEEQPIINTFNAVNDILLELEKQAIDLTYQGDTEKAVAIINGEIYRTNKEKYKASLKKFFTSIRNRYRRGSAVADATNDLDLTQEEKKWIKTHTVKVGVEQWEPLVFASKTGKVQGLTSGFLNRISDSTGLEFEYVTGEWSDLLNGFKAQEIDILPATYHTEERTKFGLYTDSYYNIREFLYVKDSDKNIRSMDDMAEKRIAVISGYGTIPKITTRYPNITIVETPNLLASINAVLNGEVEALFEAQMVVEHTIKNNSIIGLKGVAQTTFKASPIHLFSNINEPLLRSILQKGLDAISFKERNEEIGKWITARETERDKLGLSDDEQEWLADHPTWRLGIDNSWPPFEFVNENGKYSGVSSGYMDVLSKRLDITIQPELGLEWPEVLEKIKSNDLDILPAIAKTPEREKFLNFTKPYVKVPIIIATHKKDALISDIDDLDDKTVGVVANYATTEILRINKPSLQLIEMPNIALLLNSLEAGEIDAAVGSLWAISHEKDRMKLDDIKITAPTPYTYELAVGVRKDWPELVPILDKALSSLTPQETAAIKNTWLAVQVQFGMDMETILIWAVPIAGGAVLVIFLVVMWNRKMGAEIEQRKQTEHKLQFTQYAVDNAAESIFWVRPTDGGLDYVNVKAYTSLGYTHEELMKLHVPEFDVDFSPEIFSKLVETLSHEQFAVFESRQQRKNGEILDVEVRAYLAENDGRQIIVANSTDITERKRAQTELADKEAQLRAALDNMSSGILMFDKDRKIQLLNDQYIGLFGFPDGLMTVGGDASASIRYQAERGDFGEGDIDEIVERIMSVLLGNEAKTYERQIYDGTIVEVILAPTPDGGTVAVYNDITKRKGAEEELRSSQQLLGSVISHSTALIFAKDIEGRYTLVNKKWEELTGLTSEEAIGLYDRDIFPKDIADNLYENDRVVIASGLPIELEEIAESREGPRIFLSLKVPLLNAEGDIEGICGIASDITERKKAEEDLNIAHQKLATAMTHIEASINYASRIQRSVLPDQAFLSSIFKDHFILWEPRDVVGGDIYWANKWGDGVIAILGDCTGHGVPGAFMTLITTGAMERALIGMIEGDVSGFLQRIHQMVQSTLGQDGKDSESDDGMELGVCYFEPNGTSMNFAGARFDLFVSNGETVDIIKGTKKGIGYKNIPYEQSYDEHVIDVKPDNTYYMTSDGMIDQVGGEKHRMFGKRRFTALLNDVRGKEMQKQRDIILERLQEYQGDEMRRDDVALIGFKL